MKADFDLEDRVIYRNKQIIYNDISELLFDGIMLALSGKQHRAREPRAPRSAPIQ